MPILRQALMPTVGSPEAIVAPSRRKRNMLDPEFYAKEDPYKLKPQETPKTNVQETLAYSPSQARDKENQGFLNEPVTGQYLGEQLARYKARAALPELLPGARVRSANAQLADPSNFQGFYEQLNQIGAIGDAQVSAASARAAHQRLAAMQSSLNTGNTGGSSGSGTPFNGSGDVGSWINQASQVLSQYGVNLSDADKSYIQTMIQHESGGNPNAINNWDSNAAAGTPSKGLMQTIDPTFNAHKIPGYDNVYDPVANIIAGVRYSISRYGSLANVPGIRGINSGSGYVGY